MTDEQVAGLARHEKAIHKNWFEETLGPFEHLDVPFESHLIKGNASEVILGFVQSNEIDLLVMGTVARTGIPGLIIGNTAETVFSQVSCSILTIKPSGFKSPVKLTARYSKA
jgi:nucleotide-binding universal stress UspA family protein